jgi:1-acyl-sn-glycerol-3-phosphate acyltransferase
MAAIRASLFNLFYAGWTALVAVIGLPAALFGYRAVYGLGRLWARVTFAALKAIIGLDHRWIGARPAGGPVIYAVKHQSAWDTMAFSMLPDRPAYVLKRELTWIPFFGWLLAAAGFIAVDRKAGAAALRRLIRDAERSVAKGRSLLIFPEGTRTAPGRHRPYQPGVAALYDRLKLPVVPVALNSGLFWGRRSFIKRPGRITVEFLPVIEPGLGRREFMALLERRIEGAATRLAGAAEIPARPRR